MTTYAPAIRDGRPAMPADAAELTDTWLVPNGIQGLLPEHATILVQDGQVTFPVWHHLDGSVGGWGGDVKIVADDFPAQFGKPGGDEPVVELRTLPLTVPVTDRVRELFAAGPLTLIER